MSSDDTNVNIANLLMTFNFEIKTMPDKLKCLECKLILKDSCHLSCGCRFCHTCIGEVMARGVQFCPGDSQDCGCTPLSSVQRDYRANKSILKLIAKCPYSGCIHECPLAGMEYHLRVCQRKSVNCPFRELGCLHDRLAVEDVSSHMQRENYNHSELLIGIVANIKMELNILKDEQLIHLQNETKLMKDEIKLVKDKNESMKDEGRSINDEIKLIKDEIKSIKDENKSIKDENKFIKDENKLIKDKNKLINDEINSIKNENKSIKEENKVIKREKEVISERVRQLTEKLEREVDERRQSDKRDSAKISAVIGTVELNRDALRTEMEPNRNDIRSIKSQLETITCLVESIQVAVVLGQLDDWLINEDLDHTDWWSRPKTSRKFRGGGRPRTYELASCNSVNIGILQIYLHIWAGPSDVLLEWPFRGTVTMSVAHRDWREKYSRQTRQCQIERPNCNDFNSSGPFEFPHTALREAGLDLKRGVRVSCQIVPGAGQ